VPHALPSRRRVKGWTFGLAQNRLGFERRRTCTADRLGMGCPAQHVGRSKAFRSRRAKQRWRDHGPLAPHKPKSILSGVTRSHRARRVADRCAKVAAEGEHAAQNVKFRFGRQRQACTADRFAAKGTGCPAEPVGRFEGRRGMVMSNLDNMSAGERRAPRHDAFHPMP
jgi:hypothetical protein